MRVGVLGPVEVDGGAVALGPRDRVVLAVLATRPGQHVTADSIAEALWAEALPASWTKVVQGCVSRLRKALGAAAIETTAAGYRLRLHRDDLDHMRFEHHVGRGRELLATGEPDRALYLLDQALALWRGDPFADLTEWEPGRTEAERLIELFRDAEELRAEAALQSGRHHDVLPDLKRLVAEQPTRERRWGLLALAQYHAGQQADALQTLGRAKAVLLNELGLDPGPGLATLEESILRQDSSLVAQSAFAPVSATCPYLGLLPYGLGDASAFFGREADTEAALRRLDQVGVLAVVGPSGSGKSSLIRAGVAAALERDGRRVAVLTPGQLPLAALDAARPQAADVLVVDQCEEALALSEDSGERADFFDRLVDFAARPGAQLVISLRADRFGDLSIHTEFARLVERGLYLLGPLREADLRRAIEGPAAQAGLRIEAGLVDLLVREVLGESGALPLLSHVLRQTWKRREGNTLTVAGYTATGGIRGAVSQSAEGLFRGLTGAQQTMVRDLMVRLVAADDAGAPIRQRVPRRSVLTNQARQEVAERLIAARLLSSDGDTLEVAHESLAVAWPRLRGWLDDDVDGLRIMRHLAVAAETWDELGRPESELYRGVRLARSVEWRDRSQPTLTPVEDDFLAASTALADREAHAAEEQARRDHRSNQRLRLALAATAAVLAVAVVAGVAAFTSAGRANRTALRSDSERLGAESARVKEVDLALLLAAAGLRLQDTAESRTNLIEALSRVPDLDLATHAPAFAMAVLPSGGIVLSHGNNGIHIHDPATLGVTGRNESVKGPHVVASARGDLIAASVFSDASTPPVLLLRPDGTREAAQLEGFPKSPVVWQSLSFDPTGRWMSVGVNPTGAHPGMVLVWDVGRRDRPVLRLKTSHFLRPIVSGDGRTLYSTDGSSLLVTNVPDGRPRKTVTAADLGVRSLTGQLLLTPDSRTLVTGGGPEAVVIDTGTLRPTAHLYDGQASSEDLSLSRDGRRLAVVGDRVIVWDLSGPVPQVVANAGVSGDTAGLSPDGSTLFVSADDNLLRLDLTGEHGFIPVAGGSPLGRNATASIDRAGTKVAYQSPVSPATLQIRDVRTGRLGPLVDMHMEPMSWTEVRWSPDGRMVSSTTGGPDAGLWDAVTGKQLAKASFTEGAKPTMFTPDGGALLVGTGDSRLHVLGVPDLEPLRAPINVGVGELEYLILSPNGREVIAVGDEASVVDYRSGTVEGRVGTEDETPVSGAFSPDGERLFLTFASGGVGLLDAETKSYLSVPDRVRLLGAFEPVWSRDGSLVAATISDGVGVWDGQTGEFIGSVSGVTGSLAFTDEGVIAIAENEGVIRSWDPRPSAWVAAACRMAGRDLTEAEWRSYLPDRQYDAVCS